jgi:hypothetical protein
MLRNSKCPHVHPFVLWFNYIRWVKLPHFITKLLRGTSRKTRHKLCVLHSYFKLPIHGSNNATNSVLPHIMDTNCNIFVTLGMNVMPLNMHSLYTVAYLWIVFANRFYQNTPKGGKRGTPNERQKWREPSCRTEQLSVIKPCKCLWWRCRWPTNFPWLSYSIL